MPWALQIQNMFLLALSNMFGSQTTFLYNRIHEVWEDEAAGIVRISLITYTSQPINSINDVSTLFNGIDATQWPLHGGSGRTCVSWGSAPLSAISVILLLASTCRTTIIFDRQAVTKAFLVPVCLVSLSPASDKHMQPRPCCYIP